MKNLGKSIEETGRSADFWCRPDAPQPDFHQADLRDEAAITKIFQQYTDIWAVVHLAALKAVGESGEKPLDYYMVNVASSISLLQVSPHSHFFAHF